ncbi:hypothetical protein [Pseudoclavibacter terrae]|uniref:Uncharacterized protein n=1 Tax=Pseudoclavibacter terrae TaxID=1530195 RepID=A0A7J5B3J0_9MICO|nr:hypothetical protein [Pseudoclavibacter terrae]KAB1638580.1 hypothetical protein F8O03_09395 [Pseudoclavibacter terrae]
MTEEARMPIQAWRAANILLDVVVAQSPTATPGDNERAHGAAVDPLVRPQNEIDESIESDHLLGAAAINISWLTSQLAQIRGHDLVDVVADLRAFLLGVVEQ